MVKLASLAHPGLNSFACFAGSLNLETERSVHEAANYFCFHRADAMCKFFRAESRQERSVRRCAESGRDEYVLGEGVQSWDARLNEAYRQFMAKLNDEEKAQLKKAQLAWITYRDANCDFVADEYKGGTMRPMIAAICLAETTNNRTTELKAQMKEREP